MALRRRGLFQGFFLALALGFTSIIILPDIAVGQETVFGPQAYYRSGGAPIAETDTFTVENPSGEYLLTIINGEAGEHRISSGWLCLNEIEEVRPSDFTQQVGTITKKVTLQETNTIEITLAGGPEGSITVKITPVSPCEEMVGGDRGSSPVKAADLEPRK